MAFRGHYEHSLDSKDRLTVPARWRGQLSEGIVLVAGLDPCVEVYSPQGYEAFSQRFLGDLNPLGQDGRMMNRRFNASAQDEALDSAGRMRIARHLIDHAEVWRPETWAHHYADIDQQAGLMAEKLAAGPGE